MTPHKRNPAGVKGGASDRLGGRSEDTPRGSRFQRPISTGRMMQALSSALADTAPEDRGELARWAASRLLLGYAHEAGFEAAAEHAYRVADVLAGVGA